MRRLSTSLLMLVGFAVLGHQEGTVPEEFVRALVGFDAELLVGELPAGLAEAIALPEGARIIGSVVGEQSTAAYLQVPGDPEAVIGFFREQLVGAGWRTPPERPRRSGFQGPPSPVASGAFCSPANAVLNISTGGDDRGTTWLRYYAAFPRELPCDRPPRPQGMGRSDEIRERIPVLVLPEDEMQGPGRQGTALAAGRESYTTTVELHSERTAAEIAAAITEQVEAEGWVPGLAHVNDEAAVRTWSQTFDDGTEMLGSLTVVEVIPGIYELFFRIRFPPDADPARAP